MHPERSTIEGISAEDPEPEDNATNKSIVKSLINSWLPKLIP